MAEPYLSIDIDKIEHNARTVTALCARHGITVTGVTKGVCGEPEVARAMLRGGVCGVGESRLANIARLRAAGIDTRYLLLRIPALSKAEEIVAAVDASINSELAVVRALSDAACRGGRRHDIVVMVDLGDLREGVWPDQLPAFVEAIRTLPGLRIVGLATNLSCYSGVVPTEEAMLRFVQYAEEVEGIIGRRLGILSAGASNVLPMIAEGRMPKRVDNVRVGEAILLGRETVHRTALPGTFQDAFRLGAEIIELKRKPSLPVGELAEDAYGQRPRPVDRGDIDRAIVNVGRADVQLDSLQCVDPRFTILGASGDQLLVDVSAAAGSLDIGDTLCFSPGYGALLAAMMSPYVEKRLLRSGAPDAPAEVRGRAPD